MQPETVALGSVVQPAVCHLVRRDSSAIKFDRAGIALTLAPVYWLKPLTYEGRSPHVLTYVALEIKTPCGAVIAQLVVLGLAVHSVAGSILLWGHFPVQGIFPLEIT